MAVTIGNIAASNAYANHWAFTLDNNGQGVVVCLMMDSGNTMSGLPTVDGNAMTLARYQASSGRKCWIYYIDDVEMGEVSVNGNLTGSSYRYVWAASLQSADPNGSLGNVNSSGGTSSSRSLAVNTEPNSILVAAMCVDNNPGAITPGSGTTEYVDSNIAGTTNKAWVGTEPGDGGSVTIGCSWVASKSNAMVAIEIRIGGQMYLIPVAGTLDLVGGLTRSTSHIRSMVGVLDLAGGLAKATSYVRPIAGVLDLAGSLARATSHVRSVSGALDLSGSLARATSHIRSMAGTLDLAGSLAKVTSYVRLPAGVLDLAGSLVKATSYVRPVAGVLDLVGSLARATSHVRSVVGSIDFSGSLAKATSYVRPVAGALDLAGEVTWLLFGVLYVIAKFLASPIGRILYKESPTADAEFDESPEGRIRSK